MLSRQIFVSKPNISGLLHQFTDLWWQSSTDLPDLGREYSLRQQLENERHFDHLLNELLTGLRRATQDPAAQQLIQRRLSAAAAEFAQVSLGLDPEDIQAVRSSGFIEAGAEFIRQARCFDPTLSDADIFQASRNVWSMNLIQILLGYSVEITPCVLGYSLLYPYTDNYLDDPRISTATKASFNARFQQRLAGQLLQPDNRYESILCDLIAMIEAVFERSAYPQVYDSLLAIHTAQVRSLDLIQPSASPFTLDLLGICFEKGGTSVLADGYLIAGDLSAGDQELMYHYGTFTQLMDDLEDLRSDQKTGIQTVFSLTAGRWPLDKVINRTFDYGNQLIDRLDKMETSKTAALRRLMRRAVPSLLMAEAGMLRRCLSRPYFKLLQAHFPFRFSFLEAERNRLARQDISAASLLEILANSPGL